MGIYKACDRTVPMCVHVRVSIKHMPSTIIAVDSLQIAGPGADTSSPTQNTEGRGTFQEDWKAGGEDGPEEAEEDGELYEKNVATPKNTLFQEEVVNDDAGPCEEKKRRTGNEMTQATASEALARQRRGCLLETRSGTTPHVFRSGGTILAPAEAKLGLLRLRSLISLQEWLEERLKG